LILYHINFISIPYIGIVCIHYCFLYAIMQPLWKQNISFKQALAIAALQKRKFDEEIKQQEQRNAELQDQIEGLKLELKKYKAEASPELLLSKTFSPLGNHSPCSTAAEEESFDFALQLDTLAISATLWTNAAEILPLDTHTFLCQVLNYTAQRKKTTTQINNSTTDAAAPSSTTFPLAGGTPTPAQALIQLTHDIIATLLSSSSSAPKMMEEVLVKAAFCLGQLCKHPHDCLTLQDFSLLQESISTLIITSCCRKLEKIQSNVEKVSNIEENAAENWTASLAGAVTTEASSALCLLEAFQSSCGTGYLALGCAAHTLQSYMQRLRGLVTGELELEVDPPPSPSTTMELIIEENLLDEESLVNACGNVARIVQSCLRELPSWSAEMTFQDEFLEEIAAAVWDINAASEVIAPAHAEIAKQGQRCAALMVSALQQMSAISSRDDCGTTIVNDF
jgi:hypothetical protein